MCALSVPLIEISIAIGLLIARFRNIAVILAFIMHVIILYLLGPLGNNSNIVVWPWNIIMIFFVFILFWQVKTSFRIVPTLQMSFLSFLTVASLLLFWIMPFFSLFNVWDAFLLASLYAGNDHWAHIQVSDKVKKGLPKEAQSFFEVRNDTNQVAILNWSYGEFNVPFYPEIRIYKNVARYVCSFAEEPTDVTLTVGEKRDLAELFRWQRKAELFRYNCLTL